MRLAAIVLLICVAGTACKQTKKKPPPGKTKVRGRPWAVSWPDSAESVDKLITRHTLRKMPADHLPIDQALLKKLDEDKIRNFQSRGWEGVSAAIKAWMLGHPNQYKLIMWGTHHDAAEQLSGLKHVIRGLASVLDIAFLEQFDADGRWADLRLSLQRGDTRVLNAYHRGTDPKAFEQIFARQKQENVTARKFGYLDLVMSFLPLAKREHLSLWGCDMPARLQVRAAGLKLSSEQMLRFRELHCILGLEHRHWLRRKRGRTMLMAWGRDHLGPKGIRRFIHPKVMMLEIYVYGHRKRAVKGGIEDQIAQRQRFELPTLVRVDHTRAALILPGARLRK